MGERPNNPRVYVTGDRMTIPQMVKLRRDIDNTLSTLLSAFKDAYWGDAKRRVQAAVLDDWVQNGEGGNLAAVLERLRRDFTQQGYIRDYKALQAARKGGKQGPRPPALLQSQPITPDANYSRLARQLLFNDFPWASEEQLGAALNYHKGWYAEAYMDVSKTLKLIQDHKFGRGQPGPSRGGKAEGGTGAGPSKAMAPPKGVDPPVWAGPGGLQKMAAERQREVVDIGGCVALQYERCVVRKWREPHNVRKLAHVLDEKEREQRRRQGERMECGCCYNDQPIELMVQCQDAHIFCQDCVKRTVEEILFGVKRAEKGVRCMWAESHCEAVFPKSQLRIALSPETLAMFEQRQAEDSVQQALGAMALTKCHACPFRGLLDDYLTELECPRCQKVTCRACGKEAHPPLRCDQVETQEQQGVRQSIEEEMTRKMVRECSVCKMMLLKEGGCNKITCRCGALTCYVCRQNIPPNVGYEHFCSHPREAGQGCTQCQRCYVWEKTEVADEADLRRIQEERVREAAARDARLADRRIGPDLGR